MTEYWCSSCRGSGIRETATRFQRGRSRQVWGPAPSSCTFILALDDISHLFAQTPSIILVRFSFCVHMHRHTHIHTCMCKHIYIHIRAYKLTFLFQPLHILTLGTPICLSYLKHMTMAYTQLLAALTLRAEDQRDIIHSCRVRRMRMFGAEPAHGCKFIKSAICMLPVAILRMDC